jgi:uncharacterized protein (TIGR03086 family)
VLPISAVADETGTTRRNHMLEGSDPRGLFERALAQTESIIVAIEPDQLESATPCDDYDVRELINHLVGAVHRSARVGEVGEAGELETPEGGTAATAAWADDARLDAMVEVPWGKAPGRGAVAGYTMEVVVHGWDLAKATGQPVEGDETLGAAMLGLAKQMLPAEPRGGDLPFGPVMPTTSDAGPYTLLAAWLGRRP